MSEILNLLSYTFMQRAILCGIAISFSAALIGVILTLKNYSMIGHGLGEVGFSALALAMALNLPPIGVAIPIVIISAIIMIIIKNSFFKKKQSKEEMKRFCKLYNVLKKVYITDIIEFRNFKLKELTDEEINQYSFEILEGSLPLWDFNVLGTINTDLLSKTIEIEDEKARKGQSLQTSIEKYKKNFN